MGTFVRPNSLTQALEVRASGAEILAGGTDFWPVRVTRPTYAQPSSQILDLSALEALRGIDTTGDAIRIGALSTWTDIADATLPAAFRALQQAAREVGGRQVQNRGTLAGNLCNASPAADSAPPLLALDATVELASLRGSRTMPLGEFLIGPRRTALRADEVMTAIVVPRPAATARSAFVKIGARRYQLISIVMVAATLDVRHGRVDTAAVAIGSCSPVALRLGALEHELQGATAANLAARVAPGHLASLMPLDDIRADAAYRRDAAVVAVKRALVATAGDA